ncbi:MAG: YraN family protein [Thermoactinomyces sp.]
MMGDTRKQVGRQGEELAARYLTDNGYEIIDRNWTSRQGELDIIALKDGQLVFVEVRTTQSSRYGYGLESVGYRKQQKLRQLALQYLQENPAYYGSFRFDVISVLWDRQGLKNEVQHIEGAF